MPGPDEFIPMAATSGLIIPLGEWVLCEPVPARELETWYSQRFANCRSAPDQLTRTIRV